MRPGSPPRGFSTLTTSAPSWPRTSVQVGPASNCVRSKTRIPARQFGGTAASVIVFLLSACCAENNALTRRSPWTRKGHEGACPTRNHVAYFIGHRRRGESGGPGASERSPRPPDSRLRGDDG